MVFRTGHGDDMTLWACIDWDAATHLVCYVPVTPASRFGFVGIVCREALEGRTEATIAYAFTALMLRGREIIEHIFKVLSRDGAQRLLPDDVRTTYEADKKKGWRLRTICDFVSSMTDRYCVEFYSRLIGINAPSIYKPY